MVLSHGIELSNVHSPLACEGGSCVIHNPSQHFMADWPAEWAYHEGAAVLFRQCIHGEAHPDPDQQDFFNKRAPHLAAHACCEENCCGMESGRYNAAKCHACNTVVVSRHRHDFAACKCGNVFVDGGYDYSRRGVRDPEDYEDLSR